MRKQWLVGSSVAIIVVAVAAGLVVSRAKSGEGPDGKGKKPEVTLEFTPAEVVKPVLTAMPERIEFSGALMAPRTAVVRAKANGTLLTLEVAEAAASRPGRCSARSTCPTCRAVPRSVRRWSIRQRRS
jgi:hypothetical protein